MALVQLSCSFGSACLFSVPQRVRKALVSRIGAPATKGVSEGPASADDLPCARMQALHFSLIPDRRCPWPRLGGCGLLVASSLFSYSRLRPYAGSCAVGALHCPSPHDGWAGRLSYWFQQPERVLPGEGFLLFGLRLLGFLYHGGRWYEAELFFLAASFLTGVNLNSSMASTSTRFLPISIGSELGLFVPMVRVGLPCQQFRFRLSPLSPALGWQLSVSPGI